MSDTVNLYEAKTRLSELVERAAAGEEIVIAKAGKPKVRLVPFRAAAEPRKPAHALFTPLEDAVRDCVTQYLAQPDPYL